MRSSLLLGAAALGLLAFSGKKGSGSSVVQRRSQQATLLNPGPSMAAMGLAESDWPAMTFDIPFGVGSPSPVWPVVTSHSKKFVVSYKTATGQIVGNSSRRFMAGRLGKYHVGMDIYGNAGDVILAMEDGVVTNTYDFYHGTYCLFVQCNSGLVINYGEVARNSWKEFGLGEGSRVARGYPIARVGQMSGGSHMLHFETYMPPTEKNKRYMDNRHDPGPILNPTYYILRARFLALGAGRAFAGTDCQAYGSLNRPIPPELQHIADEDERVGEAPGDSVLPELLTDGDWRPEKDRADGP